MKSTLAITSAAATLAGVAGYLAVSTLAPMAASTPTANQTGDAAIARAIGMCLYKAGRADQATIIAATTTWLKAQGADPRLAWERATPEVIAKADAIQSRLGPDCKSLADA